MMVTTPENIAEAKQALKEVMRREGHTSLSRFGLPQRTFGAEGGSDTDFDNRDNLGRIQCEARESARRYVESRLKYTRPDRQVDETNPAAVEGYIQAMNWLQRKGKSRLKP